MAEQPTPATKDMKKALGIERRRHKRYEVDLPGSVSAQGDSYEVLVSDISASGALIEGAAKLSAGQTISLTITGYGEIAARVVHASSNFFGLQFLEAHRHRDALAAWLRADLSEETR